MNLVKSTVSQYESPIMFYQKLKLIFGGHLGTYYKLISSPEMKIDHHNLVL